MSNFFEDRRKDLGLTQEQMAEALDMTQPAVSSWECYSSAPRIQSAGRLAVAYQVTRSEMEMAILSLSREIEERKATSAA